MPKVLLTWRDSNDKRADVSYHVGDGGPVSSHVAAAASVYEAMRPLTNAVLHQGRLQYPLDIAPGPPAVAGSDAYRRAVVILRGSFGMGSASLVSPAGMPLEPTGPFQGLKVSAAGLQSPQVQALNDAMQLYTLTPWGAPWPGPIVAILLTRLEQWLSE